MQDANSYDQDLNSVGLPSHLGLWNKLTASLQRGDTPPTSVLLYDTKQSDGEIPVILELWGIRCTPSLPSLSGQHRPGVVELDKVLSIGQIELNSVLMLN